MAVSQGIQTPRWQPRLVCESSPQAASRQPGEWTDSTRIWHGLRQGTEPPTDISLSYFLNRGRLPLSQSFSHVSYQGDFVSAPWWDEHGRPVLQLDTRGLREAAWLGCPPSSQGRRGIPQPTAPPPLLLSCGWLPGNVGRACHGVALRGTAGSVSPG